MAVESLADGCVGKFEFASTGKMVCELVHPRVREEYRGQ
jgi:hypothetical protein